ncbi:MAG: cysteine peptidase family C39 domain-containing protein [Patescibacteria group bacterium]
MGRSKAKTYLQPDDRTCGPASLKTALEILGIRKSLGELIRLCKTNRNGTSPARLIRAANRLGISVLAVEWTTLTHLQNALKHKPLKPRAVIVDYLYDLKADFSPHEESGHYATVASYSASNRRIILFDSSSGGKKSYDWKDFLDRWYDFESKKRQAKFVKSWNNHLMLVLARNVNYLPKFKISTAKLFPA